MRDRNSFGPLRGFRVIDYTQGIAGPLATMLLADLGADVIKVELPCGDWARRLAGFHVWNRGKRGLVIDPGNKEDRSLLWQLGGTADVIVDDLSMEAHGSFDFNYQSLSQHNPSLVYCKMPAWGSKGPYKDRPARDDLIQAHCGIMYFQQGFRDGPYYLVTPAVSYGTALLTCVGISTALLTQLRTGVGQGVEVSWLAGGLAIEAHSIVASQQGWAVISNDGDPLRITSPVVRYFRAKDDWILLGCSTPTSWVNFCLAAGLEQVLADQRFEGAPFSIPDREAREALVEIIADVISDKTQGDWLRILEEHRIVCAPVLSREEFINHPQVMHNGMHLEIEDRELLGKIVQMGVPISFSATPGKVRSGAPKLGEHNELIREELAQSQAHKRLARSETTGAPLAGVKVIDFASFIAGPGAAYWLGRLGADVTKVERPEGDPFRPIGFSFAAINSGKRSLVIDPDSELGEKAIRRLAEGADVIIHNFRPRLAKRLGLEYQTLHDVNPALVYCSVQGYGDSGPYSDRGGIDASFDGMSGGALAQGGGQVPKGFYGAIIDNSTALITAFGAISALVERERSNKGQKVETSLLNTVCVRYSGELIFYEGKEPEANFGVDPVGPTATCRLFKTKERWLFLAVDNLETWSRALSVLGHSESIREFAGADAIQQPFSGALAHYLEDIFLDKSAKEWVAILEQVGVPCGMVYNVGDLVHEDQIAANDLLVQVDHPECGRLWQLNSLIKFSHTPCVKPSPSAVKGQHSHEILQELGLGEHP